MKTWRTIKTKLPLQFCMNGMSRYEKEKAKIPVSRNSGITETRIFFCDIKTHVLYKDKDVAVKIKSFFALAVNAKKLEISYSPQKAPELIFLLNFKMTIIQAFYDVFVPESTRLIGQYPRSYHHIYNSIPLHISYNIKSS